jgi:hypothetical protein
MGLIKPRLDAIFKRKVTTLLGDLAKRHRVYALLKIEVDCPNCTWDALHQGGSGHYKAGGPQPFDGKVCPVCDNVGRTVTTVQRFMQRASVRLSDAKKAVPDRMTGPGEIPINHALIKAPITDEATLAAAEYFLIDGVKYKKVSRQTPPKRRGLLSPATVEILVEENA